MAYNDSWYKRLKARDPQRVRNEGKLGARIRKLKSLGLSVEDYERFLDQQGGFCAVCTMPMIPGKATHVEHDHASGKFRGITCDACNRGLSCFRDEPWRLQAAMEYLWLANQG